MISPVASIARRVRGVAEGKGERRGAKKGEGGSEGFIALARQTIVAHCPVEINKRAIAIRRERIHFGRPTR